MRPTCGAAEAVRQQVDDLEQCYAAMFLLHANVLTVNTDDFICELQFCDSWDLAFEPSDTPNINYVIIPPDYDPCLNYTEACGDDELEGECVIVGDLPSPLSFNFPRLNYDVACFCYVTSTLVSVEDGCFFGKRATSNRMSASC